MPCETRGRVFLSYARPDRPLAEGLAAGLRRRGFRVWIDQDELRIGDSLVERISEALDQVDFVAMIMLNLPRAVAAVALRGANCRRPDLRPQRYSSIDARLERRGGTD